MRHNQPDWDSDDLDPTTDPVLRQAVFWHEMMQISDPSPAALQEFQTWIGASADHARAYAGISAIWQGAGELPQLAALRQRQTRRATTRRAFLVGGLGLVAAGAAGTWLSGHPFADIRTAKGELRREILADGSRLEIAGHGALSVNFTSSGRRIQLHEGEVWFDMVNDPARPFEVVAGPSLVRGTNARFLLTSGRSENLVSVADHSVTLVQNGATPLTLDAGHQAVLGAQTEIIQADLASSLAWREGRLVYVSQPMSRIIQGVNRWGSNRVVILGDGLARREATLILDIDRIDEALDHLRQAVPMRVIEAPGGLIFIT